MITLWNPSYEMIPCESSIMGHYQTLIHFIIKQWPNNSKHHLGEKKKTSLWTSFHIMKQYQTRCKTIWPWLHRLAPALPPWVHFGEPTPCHTSVASPASSESQVTMMVTATGKKFRLRQHYSSHYWMIFYILIFMNGT